MIKIDGERFFREEILEKIKSISKGNYKKVLMINPPQIPEEDFDINVARAKNYPCFPPYGLGVLCKTLESRGYITEISDLNYDVLYNANNDTKFNYKYWRNSLEKTLKEFNPDLIGISCMYSMSHKSLKEVAKFTREIYKDKPIIVGGVHVSSAPKEVLKDCREIDLAMLYESELSFPILLEILNEREDTKMLKQVASIVDGEFKIINERITPSEKEIDIFPEYHELNIGNYGSLGKMGESRYLLPEGTKISTVLSNRGCRGNCTFCAVRGFNGKGVRQRSIDSVVKEIENLKGRYGIEHIMWLDDDLLYNKSRAIDLFKGIESTGISWNASNGVIAASIDEDMMKSINNSKCSCFYVGIESGNPEILKSIRKPSGIKHFIKASEAIRKYDNIFSKGFLMIGFPNENIEKINDTINLAKKMSLDWYATQILSPLPSTEITEKLLQKNEWDEEHFIDGSAKFFAGGIGGQRLRELEEKNKSKEFRNILLEDKNYIPIHDELKDVWFLVDYYLNYERIFNESNQTKLKLKRGILTEISDKKTNENPLSNLFLSVVEEKLGNLEESKKRMNLTKEYLENSAFWRTRFKALDLYIPKDGERWKRK